MNSNFPLKVGLIGTGNVAWHWSGLMTDAGISVTGILTRNKEKALLAGKAEMFRVPLIQDLEELIMHSGMIFLTVADNHMPAFINRLKRFDGYVVHTSGCLPLSILIDAGLRGGVFYPYQTLTKGIFTEPANIPVCIESSDQKLLELLKMLAFELGTPCSEISSSNRLIMHLAAIFASNFTNHLMAVAKQLLRDHGIDDAMVNPLIKETLMKALRMDPALAQTGPAVRNDFGTIRKHQELLASAPDLSQIYDLLTKSIIHQKEKGRV
jgi:predicted short-subunit dehydrogenase-like oxidoreductase (DUF2520 family)